MLSSVRRRLTSLETSILSTIATRFLERAHRHAQRVGGSFGTSVEVLARDLSDADLNSLIAELEEMAFGSDTAARDAARHEVFGEQVVQLGQVAEEQVVQPGQVTETMP